MSSSKASTSTFASEIDAAMGPEASDLEELRTLTAAARALAEQLRDAGAEGVPTTPAAERKRPIADAQAPIASDEPRRPPVATATATSEPRRAPATPTATAIATPAATSIAATMPALSEGERVTRLTVLREQVAACVRCGLHAHRTQTVFSRGDELAAELMFVGEGPGAEEDAQGLPFVGKSGQLLDRMIQAMGYAPSDVYVANIVKCRPPDNRKPDPNEMATCIHFLHDQIAIVQPKVIVALGATAVEGLLKLTGITKLRGQWRLYKGEIPVMPTFHPAYVLRNPPSKREVWEDLKLVMAKLGKPVP
jgi:DNA polymerase